MFQLVGAGDQAGSGVPRIFGVWKEQSWRMPVVHEKREPEQMLFELRMASLLPVRVDMNQGRRRFEAAAFKQGCIVRATLRLGNGEARRSRSGEFIMRKWGMFVDHACADTVCCNDWDGRRCPAEPERLPEWLGRPFRYRTRGQGIARAGQGRRTRMRRQPGNGLPATIW